MNNGIEKNFVSKYLVKKLGRLTTPHTYPYNISWMKDGKELRVTRKCKLNYFIKDFEYEVLCDVALLPIVNSLFRKPYV